MVLYNNRVSDLSQLTTDTLFDLRQYPARHIFAACRVDRHAGVGFNDGYPAVGLGIERLMDHIAVGADR